MTKRNAFLRYTWILRRLKAKPYTSVRELLDYIGDKIDNISYDSGKAGIGYSLSTFKRDREGLQQIFGIHVDYSRRHKGYYIVDAAGENEMTVNMLESFETFQSMLLAKELPAHVYLEKRLSIGTDLLSDLLLAIKRKVKVAFTHNKYWEDAPTMRRVAPYALKKSMDRWYLIGKDDMRNSIRCFGLDRMSAVVVTDLHFDYPEDYDVDEAFRHCFGVICPEDEEPEEIVLSFYGFQGKYLKSLPLHASQEILLETPEEIQVKLTVYVTDDLIMELMKYGEKMKVLKPLVLKEQIRAKLEMALRQYG